MADPHLSGATASHTPTTEAVRNAYIWAMRNAHVASAGEAGAEFDRWLRGAPMNPEPEITDEWEYGWFCEWADGSGTSRLLMGSETWGPRGRVFQARRRPGSAPGPWVPVGEGEQG